MEFIALIAVDDDWEIFKVAWIDHCAKSLITGLLRCDIEMGTSQEGDMESNAHPVIVLFIILLLNVAFNPTVVVENNAA